MYRKGLSIVELVVAAAIIVVVITSAVSATHLYFSLSNTSTGQIQASLLSEESVEALNYLRDVSWSQNIAPLALNKTYYIYWNATSSTYATSTTPVAINSTYTAAVIFGSVYRNASNDISDSSGTLDAGSRYATVTIAYFNNASTTLMQTGFLLHNVFQN